MSEPRKVFVSEDEIAVFVCPECGKIKNMDVSRYKDIKKAVKLKYTCRYCKCITSFFLERRIHFRKSVNLKGSYVHNNKKGFMVVTDLSRYGLKLKLYSLASIKVGDKLSIEFVLDDKEFSKVKEEVVVKNIVEKSIGVEFSSSDHYGKFGNYIAYNF